MFGVSWFILALMRFFSSCRGYGHIARLFPSGNPALLVADAAAIAQLDFQGSQNAQGAQNAQIPQWAPMATATITATPQTAPTVPHDVLMQSDGNEFHWLHVSYILLVFM
jgi:hypothetical protein